MFSRYFVIGLMAVAFMTATALADGGFNGSITYKNCDCVPGTQGDKVQITPIGGGDTEYCGIDCQRSIYNTSGCDPGTYPPGWYSLRVVLGSGTECEYSMPVTVYHGDQAQEVNLIVHGPSGEPDGGGE